MPLQHRMSAKVSMLTSVMLTQSEAVAGPKSSVGDPRNVRDHTRSNAMDSAVLDAIKIAPVQISVEIGLHG